MNRYVYAGLVEDMRAGKDVLFIGSNGGHAQHVHREMSRDPDAGERSRWRHGEEAIVRDGGGQIAFSSIGSSRWHTMTPDVAFVDTDATFDQLTLLQVLRRAGAEVILR